MERIAVIGASRGLGAELCRASMMTDTKILAVGRKMDRLTALREELGASVEVFSCDVTSQADALMEKLAQFQPDRIFYLAGGGPYGKFESKEWKDHTWAWNVSFLAAARVVYDSLISKTPPRQIVLCGSSVAENTGDPGAASYSSAKHALLGLYRSLRLEKPEFDLRLYSPGYLDTELLPKGASVRYKGCWDPKAVANDWWTWSRSNDHGGHRSLSLHPN